MNKAPQLTTLCYIEHDDKYLMLHRVKKENDINKDKYIGIGGHFEYGESPDECLLREAREETGLTLTDYRARAIITFVYGENVVEYMHLYTATGYEGEILECDEGELVWIEKDRVDELDIWEGDLIFFDLLNKDTEFFSLKLIYDTDDRLIKAVLNGNEYGRDER